MAAWIEMILDVDFIRGFLLQRNKKKIVIDTLKPHSHRDPQLPLPMLERICRMLLPE